MQLNFLFTEGKSVQSFNAFTVAGFPAAGSRLVPKQETKNHAMYTNQLNGFVVSIVIMLASMTTSQNINADDASSLAVAVQNPLASLTTLPLQANFNDGVGPYYRRSLLSNSENE